MEPTEPLGEVAFAKQKSIVDTHYRAGREPQGSKSPHLQQKITVPKGAVFFLLSMVFFDTSTCKTGRFLLLYICYYISILEKGAKKWRRSVFFL